MHYPGVKKEICKVLVLKVITCRVYLFFFKA